MRSAAQHYQAIATGRRNKIAGEHWENMIEASCEYFRRKGYAEIEKTPEPMRPISGRNSKGQFLAVFTKRAQPDYKGTLAGGRAVVFEAKHTDDDKLELKVVREEQRKQLDRHMALGAICFVLVSFRFTQFFAIPWCEFKAMKEIYGRKYITPEDVRKYQVKYFNGIIGFLPVSDPQDSPEIQKGGAHG